MFPLLLLLRMSRSYRRMDRDIFIKIYVVLHDAFRDMFRGSEGRDDVSHCGGI